MSDENKELSQDEIERLLQQAQGGGAAGGGASQEQPSEPEQPQPAAQQPAAAAGGDEDAVLDQDAKEKLMYDLYYVKNMSLLFDLTILLKTIKVLLLQRGAR